MKILDERFGMILLGVSLVIAFSSQATFSSQAGRSTLMYSTFLGGSGDDYQDQQNLAVDGAGNVIVTGRFMGDWCSDPNTCFPVTSGAYDTRYDPGDHFIAKLSADGSKLLFATYFPAELKGIAVDVDGKIYVVGLAGTGFPVTSGAYQETYSGGVSDAVVARLSSDGSCLEYATYLGGGGSDGDYWARITLGSDGSVYVVGNTTSSNFPTTQGAYSRSLKGGSDLFISRLRLNGQGSQDLLYSTYIGGSGEESGLIAGIAVDPLGNVYVAGQTGSTDFPTKNPDPFFNSLCSDTISNTFAAKLAPQGNGSEDLSYSTYLKCASVPWALAGDASGNLYITGFTVSPNFPTTDRAYDRIHNGGEDIWAIKLSPMGNVIYSTFIGGETTALSFDHGHGIAADSFGNAYVGGTTKSPLFSVIANGFDTTFSGLGDAYLVKLSPDGSNLLYGTFLGGNMISEEIMNVVVKDPGLVYVSGFTNSLEGCNEFDSGCSGPFKFPTTPGAYKETAQSIVDGAYELFVAKFNLSDSDGDGLLDGWEIQYGLNPLDATGNNGASGDPDGDGFTNLQEYQGGGDPQNPISIPLDHSSYLVNISTRGSVQTGDNLMIGGFYITGTTSKQVLIRARGPSMADAPFNVPGILSDPFLQLYSGSNVIAQNDNWQTSDPLCGTRGYICGGATEIMASGLDPCQPNPGRTSAPAGCTQESTILVTLPPGGYTATVSGADRTSGVGLIEAFEVDRGASKLINISTRVNVQSRDKVMIGGFYIGGNSSKTILLRARGPSMSGAPFNVPGTLSNPTMQLYSGSTVIAQNNDWQTTDPLCSSPAVSCGNASQITATGLDPCQPNPGQTMAPPGCAQESAILITLPPGGYTAIVSGVGGATGVGLVEVFEVN